jgi:serine/threonine protein kinase/tetratricopeptide (TPR) repeat protein
MSLAPGRTLSHYRLVEKVGEGGMGVVWRAVDTTLDREVALKVLPDEVADDPDRLSRFEREAKALASLDHANIVTIHSVEESEGFRFITMELVRGRSLDDAISKDGLSLAELFRISTALADALSAAHDKGVIHRDLKPANVMVGEDGRVRILDFGLAKLRPPDPGGEDDPTATATRIGMVVGTVPYMSPEQLKGEEIDPRTDIFSLGVLIYEMAAGRHPFRADSSAEVVSSILTSTPPSVTEIRSGLPEHLGRIIRRCLEKNPARRYRSAREVRDELADLERELASSSAAVAKTSIAEPEVPGRRWLTAAVVAGVVLITALAVGSWILKSRLAGPGGTPAIRSLAVLPLDNLMNDPEQDYFVDGMQEALITDLAKIGSLRVISRTSAMHYKGTDKRIPEIAAELGVDAVVEGSVLRAGDQVRITAQLIDARTDQHLWADSFDRRVENTLQLLSEVARSITTEIELSLTSRQEKLLAAGGPVNPEAHDAYLRGQHHFHRGGLEGFRAAVEHFERAVEIEPSFAQAWSGVAACNLVFGFFGMEPPDDVIPEARAAANRALELDPEQGPAHMVLGAIALYFEWDWDVALRELEVALELDPTNPLVYHGYADYLGIMGDIEGSLLQVMRGRDADPLGYWANFVVLGHLFMARRYEEVVEEGIEIMELFPDSRGIRGFIADALWMLDRHDEALEQYRQAWGEDADFVQMLERGLAEGGPGAAQRARGEQLAAMAESQPMDPILVARYFAMAGDADPAFEWLERAFEERDPQILHVPLDPRYDPLRADPRYDDLMRRIGLPR